MDIFLLPIIVVFGFIVCCRLRIRKIACIESDYLSYDNCLCIKGILSMVILLDHIAGIIVPRDKLLGIFHSVGFLAVAVFFFLSGYGVECQRTKRENYLNNTFILRKSITLLIPMFIINVIYLIFECTMHIFEKNINHFNFALYLFDILGIYIINGTAWYIKDLFILLILFFVFYRYISPQIISDISMFISILVITLFRAIRWNGGTGQNWGMLFCFFVGILWGRYYKQITTFVKKHYLLCLLIIGGLTAIFIGLFSTYYNLRIGKLLWRNLGTTCFVILFTILLMLIEFRGTAVKWLGGISLEVYLIHFLIVNYVTRFPNKVLAVYGAILISIIAAVIVKPMVSFSVNRLTYLTNRLVKRNES